MRDIMLPVAMTLMMTGLMLGSQSARNAIAAALLTGGMAVLSSFAEVAIDGESAIVACCLTTVLISLIVYRPQMLPPRALIVIAVLGGILVGIAMSGTANSPRAYPALLGLLTVVPASIAERNDFGIARRVVASWLVAVAMLAAVLPYVIAHPGYVPDHRG